MKNLEKIRVMVVDDHPAFRDGLSRLLQEENDLEVVGQAEDGEQAVELAHNLKPQVIIMDVSIPKLDGIEAARQIKNGVPESAVLLISAYGDQSYILAALRVGAAGFLTKDAPIEELIKAVHLVSLGKAGLQLENNRQPFSPPGIRWSK